RAEIGERAARQAAKLREEVVARNHAPIVTRLRYSFAMKRLALVLLAACSGSPAHVDPAPAPPPTPAPAPMPTIPAEVAPAGPPVAAVRVVKNTYHGVAVADPYQWLEADTPEVKAWSDGQDAYARRIVEQLPDVATFRAELAKILDAP